MLIFLRFFEEKPVQHVRRVKKGEKEGFLAKKERDSLLYARNPVHRLCCMCLNSFITRQGW